MYFLLNSVVPHGVSGPEAGAIEVIYHFLLPKFKQNVYQCISINQIGDELNEFISREPGNKIHINIKYPAYEDFEKKSVAEKNRIRLDLVHTSLIRIAEYDNKLDKTILEEIKKEILSKDFSFDFVCKTFINRKNRSLIAKIVVRPDMFEFIHYVVIEEYGIEKCKILIYRGMTSSFYFNYFFKNGSWKSENELIISGNRNEIEIRVIIDECKVDFKNLTTYPKPPFFELMKTDITSEEREKARLDWHHSLPPGMAALLRQDLGLGKN
jgi:hypothetical protein